MQIRRQNVKIAKQIIFSSKFTALPELIILEQFSVGRLEGGIDLPVEPPFGSNKVRFDPIRSERSLLDDKLTAILRLEQYFDVAVTGDVAVIDFDCGLDPVAQNGLERQQIQVVGARIQIIVAISIDAHVKSVFVGQTQRENGRVRHIADGF